MAELPTGALEVAVEIGAVASAPGSLEERAEAVLHALGRVVPFQAAQIALVNPQGSEPVSLVVHGYGDAVRAYFNSATVVEEYELLGLDRSRPPMRLCDLPVAPAEVRGWAEYLAPAGYREGLAVGLHTPDGRYIGILGLNTDTLAHPTVAARDLIGMLAPVIAHAVDPLRSIAAAARLIHDAQAGIVLTRSGGVLPLPGLPTHPLLSEGSAVLGLAARFASGTRSRLVPVPARRRAVQTRSCTHHGAGDPATAFSLPGGRGGRVPARRPAETDPPRAAGPRPAHRRLVQSAHSHSPGRCRADRCQPRRAHLGQARRPVPGLGYRPGRQPRHVRAATADPHVRGARREARDRAPGRRIQRARGMIRIGVTTRARLVRHALEPGLVDGRTCTPLNHGR